MAVGQYGNSQTFYWSDTNPDTSMGANTPYLVSRQSVLNQDPGVNHYQTPGGSTVAGQSFIVDSSYKCPVATQSAPMLSA